MNSVRSKMSGLLRHLCVAATAVLLAVVTVGAQFGVFDEAFGGELWVVRHEVTPPGGGTTAGVAYVNGTLFVADSANGTLIAYDSAGQIVPKPGAQWNAADPSSPVYGLRPHQLAAVVVTVNGIDRNAILISDERSTRVAAFDAAGGYLFTMRLERPATAATYSLSIGQLAMSPGAKFNLTNSGQTLTLSGRFAAGWVEQVMTGAVDSGALVFQGSATPFPLVSSEFIAAATMVLRSPEIAQAGPAGTNMFGVAFDTVGNLYVLDAFTERLKVYGPDLRHLFTFGTPVADGTTAEFREPWGMAFWPDASGTGGRLFIADLYNRRIVIYRPVDGPDPGTEVDALHLESVIRNFVAPDPILELFSLAVDPDSGSIAVTDYATPRAIVLQRAALATFGFQVLDASDVVVNSVCTGTPYQIRFSLTVPRGFAKVTGVAPQLVINGVPTSAPARPSHPSSTLSGGQVVSYTYTLTAPVEANSDIHVIAGATATSTADIKMRSEVISLGDCASDTDPSSITATPSRLPQVSGWTPVFEGEPFFVTLVAKDNDGVESIEYQLEGANDTGDAPVSRTFAGDQPAAEFKVPIDQFGRTTLRYRVRDSNHIWSGWQTLRLNLKLVIDRNTSENTAAAFRVGEPDGGAYTYSVAGLPAGATFSTATGWFGGVISYSAHDRYSANPAVKNGEYHVVVTEGKSGGPTSSVSFTWTINNINRPPTITAPGDQGSLEGEEVSLQVVASDADGDPLYHWNVTGLPPGLWLSPSGLITGTPPYRSAGVYYPVHLSVTDGGQPSVTTFQWTVNQGRPVVNNPGPQSSTENDLVAIPIVASDADGDALSYSAAGLPPGLSIGRLTGLISGRLTFSAAGKHGVEVTVTGGGQATTVSFLWVVTNKNQPPDVIKPANQSSAAGATVALPVLASDLDLQALTYSATGLPAGLSMNSVTGVISGTIVHTAAPDNTVTVTASDGAASDSEIFTWVVTNFNRPPICEATATPSMIWPPNHKKVYLSVVGVVDPEGGAIRVRYTGILQDEPTNSVGDGNTMQDGGIEQSGTSAWVRAERSGAGDGRVYLVNFTAMDPAGASCSGTARVGVAHDQRGRPAVLSPGRWNSRTGQMLSARRQ